MTRINLAILLSFALLACGPSADTGPVKVAIIGEPQSLFQQGVRLSPAAQHLRAASFEGLVSLNPTGQIVPAIAERWIVTDDGLSYIFRLRNTTWPDGEPVTANDIRTLFRDTLTRLEGTSLGLDFAKVTDIRAMTGRVIELRLSSPMPEFLRLLAQPEMGFVKNGGGTGPMVASRDGDALQVSLNALPSGPLGENSSEVGRSLLVEALPAERAVQAFLDGQADLLLNGRLSSFPLAELGPLSRGAAQVDPAQGLFGLVVRNESGLLADPERREALSMALDRNSLIEPFGIGGWQPTTWIVPPAAFSSAVFADIRWETLTLEERRDIARQRIAAWKQDIEEDEAVVLTVGLPIGPGSDLLFEKLAENWQSLGIDLQRVAPGEGADLELRDRLARYSSPRWFLNQFNCELEIGLCSPEADQLVRESLTQKDPLEKQRLFAEAHSALVAREAFIPLGAPVRWSLVRGAVGGYQANQWGWHPLFPLSQPTT